MGPDHQRSNALCRRWPTTIRSASICFAQVPISLAGSPLTSFATGSKPSAFSRASDVFGDPRSKGADQAAACGGNPGDKISLFPISDHGVKPISECSRGDQRRHTGLDSRYGDGIGFAHVITRRRHQPCDHSSRGHLLQLLIAALSERRRRVAHSLTTRCEPRKPSNLWPQPRRRRAPSNQASRLSLSGASPSRLILDGPWRREAAAALGHGGKPRSQVCGRRSGRSITLPFQFRSCIHFR